MRPSCWTVPAILPPGHHMMVAGAPVASTTPRQTHMSDLMSTLVRRMVRTVSSLSATVMLAASLAGPWALHPWSGRTRPSAGRGAAIMPTPMVAREALARSIIDFCLSLTFASADAL